MSHNFFQLKNNSLGQKVSRNKQSGLMLVSQLVPCELITLLRIRRRQNTLYKKVRILKLI